MSENSTLIDNIFTTNLSSDLSAHILDMHISDHHPIILCTSDDLPPTRAKYNTIRSYLELIQTIEKMTSNNVFIINMCLIN